MTRHGKATPGEARRGKTRRRPDKKVSPGFEKYCKLRFLGQVLRGSSGRNWLIRLLYINGKIETYIEAIFSFDFAKFTENRLLYINGKIETYIEAILNFDSAKFTDQLCLWTDVLHYTDAMAICQPQAFVVLICAKANGTSTHISLRYVMNICLLCTAANTSAIWQPRSFLIWPNTSHAMHHDVEEHSSITYSVS